MIILYFQKFKLHYTLNKPRMNLWYKNLSTYPLIRMIFCDNNFRLNPRILNENLTDGQIVLTDQNRSQYLIVILQYPLLIARMPIW